MIAKITKTPDATAKGRARVENKEIPAIAEAATDKKAASGKRAASAVKIPNPKEETTRDPTRVCCLI